MHPSYYPDERQEGLSASISSVSTIAVDKSPSLYEEYQRRRPTMPLEDVFPSGTVRPWLFSDIQPIQSVTSHLPPPETVPEVSSNGGALDDSCTDSEESFHSALSDLWPDQKRHSSSNTPPALRSGAKPELASISSSIPPSSSSLNYTDSLHMLKRWITRPYRPSPLKHSFTSTVTTNKSPLRCNGFGDSVIVESDDEMPPISIGNLSPGSPISPWSCDTVPAGDKGTFPNTERNTKHCEKWAPPHLAPRLQLGFKSADGFLKSTSTGAVTNDKSPLRVNGFGDQVLVEDDDDMHLAGTSAPNMPGPPVLKDSSASLVTSALSRSCRLWSTREQALSGYSSLCPPFFPVSLSDLMEWSPSPVSLPVFFASPTISPSSHSTHWSLPPMPMIRAAGHAMPTYRPSVNAPYITSPNNDAQSQSFASRGHEDEQGRPTEHSDQPPAPTSTSRQDQVIPQEDDPIYLMDLDSTVHSQRRGDPYMNPATRRRGNSPSSGGIFTAAQVNGISGGTFYNVAHIYESDSPASGGG